MLHLLLAYNCSMSIQVRFASEAFTTVITLRYMASFQYELANVASRR